MITIERSPSLAGSTEDVAFIPFTLPDITTEETTAVVDTLESGWITTGSRAREFEQEFAAKVGARHALALNSCTAALHLALDALGVKRGAEVITSPYTFAATAEVVRYFDATPVFVDVEPVTLNIDPTRIERAITKSTRGIVPVHVAGFPAAMDEIIDIARHYHLPVVEDAAHAFPCAYRDRSVGSIGDCTCFSFYATKTITTGEGGMLCTDSDALLDRCRIMSLHGISKHAWNRYAADGTWSYEIMAPGYKYNLTDIAASLGIVQLHRAGRMWLRRREIASRYNGAFADVPQLQIPHDDQAMQHAWHLYMLRLNLERLTCDRAVFASELKNRGIGISVHFIPLHIHPYYRDLYDFRPDDFPVAYHEYLREISLPIYSKMDDTEVDRVIDAVLSVVEHHKR